MTPPPMSGLALNALEKVDGGRSTVFSVLLLECSKNAIGATHTHTHTERERERLWKEMRIRGEEEWHMISRHAMT